ncbi:hypothetical protein TNIN_31181 [Trichonephila inaurata madagascariensis]|uniref:Uncharacterized protein n=1 Tax=Trichonephila inaurata madagascariensis TaxID=2747483 RepID=A0A8X6YN41_9ARAC|nr:hypothetical protein TNIN_31181 [Trichonephila inaurata madagascariensis]
MIPYTSFPFGWQFRIDLPLFSRNFNVALKNFTFLIIRRKHKASKCPALKFLPLNLMFLTVSKCSPNTADVHYEKSGNDKKTLLRQPVTQKQSHKSKGSTWQFYKLHEMGSCSLDYHE